MKLWDDVRDSYRMTSSLNKTATELGISYATVRKILITLGLWSSPRTDRIMGLYRVGMPIKDIAATLHITNGAVSAHMPYVKGSYLNPNKSVNAIRVKKSKIKAAAREKGD